MRIIKNLLVVGVVAGVVMLLLSLIGKANPVAAVAAAVDKTINVPQPGTALDNIAPGGWQDFFSFPYRVAHALGLMPDLPPIGGSLPGGPVFDVGGGIKVPAPDPTGSIPDARLYPGDGGYTNA